MYKRITPTQTTLNVNTSYEGETIEQKIDRILNNKEPIKDGAPQLYTDRRDGVKPEYDIRTDRFELAVDAMNHLSKTHIAKRHGPEGIETKIADQAKEGMKKENDGVEPIRATDN